MKVEYFENKNEKILNPYKAKEFVHAHRNIFTNSRRYIKQDYPPIIKEISKFERMEDNKRIIERNVWVWVFHTFGGYTIIEVDGDEQKAWEVAQRISTTETKEDLIKSINQVK